MQSLWSRNSNTQLSSHGRRGLHRASRNLAIKHWPRLLMGSFLFAACVRTELQPVDIAAEDMCAFCKMAISEKRYVGEFIDHDGNAFKFDELGCMVRYLQDKDRSTVVGYFVTDFESRHWVKAELAHYVRSLEFRTPMNGGIVAFQDKSKAERAAGEHHGQLLSFADVLEKQKAKTDGSQRY